MSLPRYLQAAASTPAVRRSPWYTNVAPTYASIFLSVVFYLRLGEGTISQASLAWCMAGLVLAGLLCFGLFYYVPAMLGMRTGYPFYVVAAATFGAEGNLLPGLLLGALNLGFFAAVTYFATDFIALGLHTSSHLLFLGIALVWGYVMAWIAIQGIHYVAQLGHVLNWVPLAMVVVVFWSTRAGIPHYRPAQHHPVLGVELILDIIIGFFATAGAAGADFAMNCRNRKDVVRGGLVGITLAMVVAGGLALSSVAGAIGQAGMPAGANPFDYTTAITRVGALGNWFLFLFAAALLVPTCFSCFIAANSFAAMLPRIPRRVSTLVGASGALVLTVTGVAGNLIGFFSIVGACFGPVCGAMAAEYWLSGGQWRGPRQGFNLPGYVAWALGCIVGLLGFIPGVPEAWRHADHPAALYSTLVALVVYWALAKAGWRTADHPEFAARSQAASLQT